MFEEHKGYIECYYGGNKKSFWKDFLRNIIVIYFFVEVEEKERNKILELERRLIRRFSPKYNRRDRNRYEEPKCFATLKEAIDYMNKCIEEGI